MILVGSQRGGARALAAHLLNDKDDRGDKEPNDHVTVHELRGFVAEDLTGALDEMRAIAKGTRAKQFMFSLSVNPPKDADASIESMIAAGDRAGEILGLQDQPRAIVVHEKNGRRHIHLVFSRIDAETMKAINLPFYKNKLKELSKELYLEHGWELPEGHRTNGWKNPLAFSFQDWQQCKRVGLDTREILQVFQEAWLQSDNLQSFRNALEDRGYFLAKGDRRGFVATDINGEIYSVARWAGVKTKDVTAKLGKPDHLPDVADVRTDTRKRLTRALRGHLQQDRKNQQAEFAPLGDELRKMVRAHRVERARLAVKQRQREQREAKARAAKFRRGLGAVLDFVTGRSSATRKQNETEAYAAFLRDRAQREGLFFAQMKDRQALQKRIDAMHERHRAARMRAARRAFVLLRFSEVGRASDKRPKPRI